MLNEPLQRPQGWAQGSVREVVEAISVTVMSVCFLPSTSLLLCLICSVILHTVRLFTRTKMNGQYFLLLKLSVQLKSFLFVADQSLRAKVLTS